MPGLGKGTSGSRVPSSEVALSLAALTECDSCAAVSVHVSVLAVEVLVLTYIVFVKIPSFNVKSRNI